MFNNENMIFVSRKVITIITDIEKAFLEKLKNGEITKEDVGYRYSITMTRIQEQIDKNMANLLWLVENMPEILADEKSEIDDEKLERYRRFKALAYAAGKLNPMYEFESVGLSDILKKLSQLYPKYYFEILKKRKEETSV